MEIFFSGSQKCFGRSVPCVSIPIDHIRAEGRNCKVKTKTKQNKTK